MRRFVHVILAISVLLQGLLFAQSIVLRGTIVTPATVIDDGIITMNGPTIVSVRPSIPADTSTAVNVDGVIFPGLIDLHNHITWNAFPRWKPPRMSSDRYEWQEMPEYLNALSNPHTELVNAGYNCDLNRYGELKAIINGATSTMGSIRDECIRGLARNLDFLSELTPGMKAGDEPFRNEVFPLEIKSSCGEQAMRDVGRTLEDCAVGPGESRPVAPRAFVAHVAEGVDASARREFTMFAAHGYLHPGGNIIHGVGLKPDQFSQMAMNGVGLIWSPRSNFELYGKTTDVAAARSAGVMIAIAPDWSPSGSTGMLAELAYVDRLQHNPHNKTKFHVTSQELVEMATVNPARLVRLDDRIGKLASGYAADLLVMRRASGSDSVGVYDALVHQRPTDLLLVMIGGTPIFGEPRLMARLLPNQKLEQIMVCGEQRLLNVRAGTYRDVPWSDTETKLRTALAQYGIPLARFVQCTP